MKGKAFVLCVSVVVLFSGNNENNTSEKLLKRDSFVVAGEKMVSESGICHGLLFQQRKNHFSAVLHESSIAAIVRACKKAF